MAKRTKKQDDESLKQDEKQDDGLKGFQLLDANGAPAQTPESVVSMVWRDEAGRLEIFPFKWTICGGIGHTTGPAQPAQHCIRAVQ